MKPKFQTRRFTKTLFAAITLAAQPAYAANSSWIVNADGNWIDAPNWTLANGIPGATSGTTSTDIATFGTSLTADRTVTVDANRNIGGITFSNTANFSFTLSGDNILLSNGGTIQTTSASGTYSHVISSPIQIQGDGGAATIGANTGAAVRLLSVTDVTGVSTGANVTALTLNAVSTGLNTVIGVIGDGAGGGKLSLTKSGAGTWRLSGANTYTGGTSITGGVLILNSADALGSSGMISFGNGTSGSIQFSANNNTDYSSRFSAAASQNFRFNTNGASVTFASALVSTGGSLVKGGAGTLTLGAASNLDGGYTVSAGTLNLGGFTHTTSGTVALDTGTVSNGTFNNSGSYTSTGDSPVVSATLNGTAGLTRNGLNSLQLQASNGFSGGTTLTSGEVRIFNVNSLGTGNVSFGGGLIGLGANLGTVSNTMSVTGTNSYRFDSTSFSATFSADLAGGVNNGLSKGNAGTISLTGINSSYGGVTNVSRGSLFVSFLANGGINSSMGSSSSAAGNLIIGGPGASNQAFLRHTGASNSTTDRLFTISNASGISATIESSGAGTVSFTNTGSIAFTGTSLTTRTFGLGGTNTGDNSFAPGITDGDAATSFSKAGAGKWILTNATNSYTGSTNISGGTLSVSTLADGGTVSHIGASTNAASNLLIGNGATLLYTGTATSTDRLFRLNGTAALQAFTLNASGTGALNFTNTGSLEYGTTAQTRTLNLRGTNTGANTLSALIENNGVGGATTLVKQDVGTWVITGANTYTGVTTVSGGTLLINGAQTGATGTVTCATGATIGGTGSLGGALTISSGGTLAPGVTTGTLSTVGNTTVSNNGIYACDVSGASSDTIAVGGNLTLPAGAKLAVSAVAPSAASYVIATYVGTLTGTFTADPVLPSGFSLDYATPGQVKLLFSGGPPVSAYDTFASVIANPADRDPTDDPDADGISNLAEFVLGGNPTVSSQANLPTQVINATNIVLSYKRTDASEEAPATSSIGQYSTDLVNWTDVTPALVNENGTAADDMSVTVPKSNAVNGKLFVRVRFVK